MKASLYLMLWVVTSALIVSAVQIVSTFAPSWRHGYQTLNAAQLVFIYPPNAPSISRTSFTTIFRLNLLATLLSAIHFL
ncbi:hypothetical protein F5Y06DRAFT_257594 [Hypoxylon sp. FL0890]|nr:hypothetical protein F5Y06DRAFT_257594 [Hypoxylon sp. FL0890]